MRTKILSVAIIICTVLVVGESLAKGAITDVSIEPVVPTTSDPIEIFVSGTEMYGGVTVTDSVFTLQDTSIGLDLYLSVGLLTVVTNWSYSESIDPLSAGTFDLLVRTFEDEEVTITYPITFEVIPEPATFLLLAAGTIGFRLRGPIYFAH